MKAEGILRVQKVLAGDTFSWQAKVTEQDCRYIHVEKYVRDRWSCHVVQVSEIKLQNHH